MDETPLRNGLSVTTQPLGMGDLNLVHHIAESSNVVMNVRTDYVVTTRDKIEIALTRKLPLFLRKTAWTAPTALLLGLAMSIVTSDFADFMGLSKDVWATVFVFSAILALIWLIRCLWMLRKAIGLQAVIDAVIETHDLNDTRPLQGTATRN